MFSVECVQRCKVRIIAVQKCSVSLCCNYFMALISFATSGLTTSRHCKAFVCVLHGNQSLLISVSPVISDIVKDSSSCKASSHSSNTMQMSPPSLKLGELTLQKKRGLVNSTDGHWRLILQSQHGLCYTQCHPAANSVSKTLADCCAPILRAGLTRMPSSSRCAAVTACLAAAPFMPAS